uniref:Uncharacterized protein n=1 Tax=Pyrodinium bahamense TaxID=73915 RepID=A0A7S0FA07_9DINO
MADDGWSSCWERPHWKGYSSPKQNWKGAKRHQDEDWWMTPFDELIGGTSFNCPAGPVPMPVGASPAVCIWGGAGEVVCEANGGEFFTDGHQLYQPVSSCDGQQLFTDGHQLYAAVCVAVPGGPQEFPLEPPAAACHPAPAPAQLQELECEEEQQQQQQVETLLQALSPQSSTRTFDPYNSVGISPLNLSEDEGEEATARDAGSIE